MCLTRRCLAIGENSSVETFQNTVNDGLGGDVIDVFLASRLVEDVVVVELVIRCVCSVFNGCVDLQCLTVWRKYQIRFNAHCDFFLVEGSDAAHDFHVAPTL